MRFLEGIFFVSLAGVAHLGVWSTTPQTGGNTPAGADGQNTLTVSAAQASHAVLLEKWDRTPTTAPTPAAMTAPNATPAPTVSPPNEIATTALPAGQLAPVGPAPRLPQIDTAPPPPPQITPSQDLAKLRPQARPPTPESAPQKRQVAAGTGGQSAQGASEQTAVSARTGAQSKALMAQWGAKINAKIQRNVIYPSGTFARGTAKVRLAIRSDGRLTQVSLQRSTGDAVLDRAALRSAKRAGRFARAPAGLDKASYVFSISVTFARN